MTWAEVGGTEGGSPAAGPASPAPPTSAFGTGEAGGASAGCRSAVRARSAPSPATLRPPRTNPSFFIPASQALPPLPDPFRLLCGHPERVRLGKPAGLSPWAPPEGRRWVSILPFHRCAGAPGTHLPVTKGTGGARADEAGCS